MSNAHEKSRFHLGDVTKTKDDLKCRSAAELIRSAEAIGPAALAVTGYARLRADSDRSVATSATHGDRVDIVVNTDELGP